MYGRDGRIGIAILDSDLTIEPDLRRLLPEGIEIHAARVPYPRRVSAENMRMAAEGAVNAFKELLPVRPAALAWACTSGSFHGGRHGDRELLEKLGRVAEGIPVTTASTALVEALKVVNARRPAVGAPYSPEMNERLRVYLTEAGLEPAGVVGLYAEEQDDFALQDVEEDQIAEFIKGLDRADCDSVAISCTGLPTARVVSDLERELGKPVITSNLAILWHCWVLGELGGRPSADCFLFRTLKKRQRNAP